MCPKKSRAADTDSHDVTFHPGRPGEPSGTAKSVTSDIIQSRDYEMKTYLSSMEAMYENAIAQNSEVYDIAFELTKGFSRITASSVLKDSRIIKTLRYAVAPSISQMKFGQFVGVTSIDRFENNRISRETARRTELAAIAGKIATFARKHLDRRRFIWLADNTLRYDLVYRYAKDWTCSIAADQNAQTNYRNWRKEQQESAITTKLVSLGYVKSGYVGIVRQQTDINIGEYTKEIRVEGLTRQKADLAFRSRRSGKLVLIEAKAVGVELDATKRIKECCDKARDWRLSAKLKNPEIVAVIAGFFTLQNISNLEASGVHVVWEHRLDDLARFDI
jgi:hypothetical protein